MSNGALIRRAIPSDADRISSLTQTIQSAHAAAMPDTFKPADEHTFAADVIRALLPQPETVLVVAAHGDYVVGHAYAEVQHVPESGIKFATSRLLVHQLVVDVAWQRQGIGGHLMAHLCQVAEEQRIQTVVLDVWSFNAAAHDFYDRIGFRDVRYVMHASSSPLNAPRFAV